MSLDQGILVCPTRGKALANGYVYSVWLSKAPIGTILDPCNEFLILDGETKTAGSSIVANVAYGPGDLDYRHSGKLITACLDGHVTTTDGNLLGSTPNMGFGARLVGSNYGGYGFVVDSSKPADGDKGKAACFLPGGFALPNVGRHGYKLFNLNIGKNSGTYVTKTVVKEPFTSGGTTLSPDLGTSALPVNCGCNQKPHTITIDGSGCYGGWGSIGNAGTINTWDIKVPSTDFTRHTITFDFAGPCGGPTNNLATINATTNSGAARESSVLLWPTGGQAAAIWQVQFVGNIKLIYKAVTNSGHPNCVQGPGSFFLD